MGIFDELKKVAKRKMQEAIPDQIVPTAQTLTPISAEQKLQEARIHYRLPRQIEQLILEGVSCSKCASELKKDPAFSNLSPKELDELCHTAMVRLFNERKAQQMIDSHIEYYQIATAGDEHVCASCKHMENRIFQFSNRKIGVNFPPFHLGCRCTFLTAVGDWDERTDSYIVKRSKIHENRKKELAVVARKDFLLEWQNLISEPSDKLYMNEKQLRDFSAVLGNRNIQILNNCANLMQTTTNIDIFFSRYDSYMEALNFLSKLERFVKMEGDSPTEKMREISDQYDSLVMEFIDRYWEDTKQKAELLKTEKGRINRYKKFQESFEQYRSRLSKRVLDYLVSKSSEI